MAPHACTNSQTLIGISDTHMQACEVQLSRSCNCYVYLHTLRIPSPNRAEQHTVSCRFHSAHRTRTHTHTRSNAQQVVLCGCSGAGRRGRGRRGGGSSKRVSKRVAWCDGGEGGGGRGGGRAVCILHKHRHRHSYTHTHTFTDARKRKRKQDQRIVTLQVVNKAARKPIYSHAHTAHPCSHTHKGSPCSSLPPWAVRVQASNPLVRGRVLWWQRALLPREPACTHGMGWEEEGA